MSSQACRLAIELRIVAKNAFLVERQAPRRRQIVGEPRADANAVVEPHHTLVFGLEFRDGAGKGLTEASNQLE